MPKPAVFVGIDVAQATLVSILPSDPRREGTGDGRHPPRGDAPDAAADLRRQVEARFEVGEVYESRPGRLCRPARSGGCIGPVIGTYTGPDALGLCFRTP